VRRAIVVALVLAATGCSLPLPKDVQSVHAVEAKRRQDRDIQVLPPGPKDGQSPQEIVEGFLGAQANADDHHAIARQFLTEHAATSWNDAAEVQVYLPDQLDIQPVPSSSDRVVVTSIVSGQVHADGSYQAKTPKAVQETYRLQQVKGAWRLSDVPPGLRLTSADRERYYQPSIVYYLASAVRGTSPHLVPDRVFLPVGGDLATTLVRRLLQPPSAALDGTATSAFPPGTKVSSVATNGAGVVAVDLASLPTGLSPAASQGLSAQLVYTLRGLGPSFKGLRLLAAGAPLRVPTEGQVQAAGDWNAYDPEGLGPNPPYFFVAARRLRSSVALPAWPATTGQAGRGGAISVDAVAVTPDRSRVALLTGAAPGYVTVRIGQVGGRTYTTGPTALGLSSPTWGSQQHGLWMVQSGRRVVLVPNGSRTLRTISVLGQPAGELQSLAVSRDGARAALVIAGQLYVGRVEVVTGVPRVADLTLVLPSINRASRVVWSSGTELVVLGSLTGNSQVLRVAVDGSAVAALNSSGLSPVAVAASSTGLLVASGSSIYASAGGGFNLVQTGGSPVYPG
jgi:hypothetical protein